MEENKQLRPSQSGLLSNRDVFFYAISVGLSIRWIAAAAATGPSSLPLWLLAIFGFSVPLILVTCEWVEAFSGEGGIYLWIKSHFGPFWGFLSGWLYWVCNLPYFASMLYFLVTLLSLAFGSPAQHLLQQPVIFLSLALVLCFSTAGVHICGLASSRWLSQIGGVATVIVLFILIGLGFGNGWINGTATHFLNASYFPKLKPDTAILWSSLVFAVGGTESLAFLRNDVKGGMRFLFRILTIIIAVQIFFYLSDTLAILAILTPEQATRLSGLPDALIAGLQALGLGFLIPLVILGIFFACLGSYSAWFEVNARLPFVAGLDAYLPKIFGQRDPKSGAPVIALATQALIVACLVILSQMQNSLKGAYDILISMSVLSYVIPFLLLFLAYFQLADHPIGAGFRLFRQAGKIGILGRKAVALIGFLASASAILCSLVPSPDSRHPLWEVMKLIIASGILILSGIGFYIFSDKKRNLAIPAKELQSEILSPKIESPHPLPHGHE